MPGHPGARSPNGLVVQMARADGPVDPRRSRVPGTPRPLQTRSSGPRRRGSSVPVCSQAPTAGRHGLRGSRSAVAMGEGWASGAPGNMAARPSTAASRPPVPEMRLGREVAEEKRRRALNSSHLPTPQQSGPHALSPGASGYIDQKLYRTREAQNLL
ncbi:uncharacterized protein LOC110301161 isoform X2 [Mus caroli]|nr:uncharacterized protein LOC110301161 isoform X2 [Mus caroli]